MVNVYRAIPNRDAQNRLVSIVVQYISTPVNNRRSIRVKLRNLVAVLRRILRNEFAPVFYPNTRANPMDILPRINGYLLAQTDTGRSARFNNVGGEELTEDTFLFLIEERIHQSSQEVTLEELEWTYFLDRDLYNQGGAGTVHCKYTTNLYKACYTEYSDDIGYISCAAYALNYRIHYDQKRYRSRQNHFINKDARELQTRMGWNRYVGISEIATFVQHFPQYRITILRNIGKNFRDTTFEGCDFDPAILSGPTKQITAAASKVIYIVFDYQHYFPVSSPQQYFSKERNNKDLVFCHHCVEVYSGSRVTHECSNWVLDQQPQRKLQIRLCEFCNQKYKHSCGCRTSRCHYCKSVFATGSGESYHRCILYKSPERPDSFQFYTSGLQNGKKTALWVYDIESRISITESVENNEPLIDDFEINEAGCFTGEVRVFTFNVREHKANLLVARNIFTSEQRIFKGDHCLQEFLYFITTYNRGNNLCYAHNAAGYDTRLIFDQAVQMDFSTKQPIMRGCKFLKFSLGNTHFHDTLLHLQGSLRSLAKEYCSNVFIEKGYFPHLFNSVENYEYVGPIPDIKYFELPFTAKDASDLENFLTWHRSWEGRTDWCFMAELEKYCINDVIVLSEIMKAHNTILCEKFNMSPWFNTTAPGYVHEVYLRRLAMTLELPDSKSDPEGHAARIQQLATEEFWAVLKPEEYDFARKALRGGRTEIRKVFHTVSPEEWDRGIRIRYQDICSQYPYQQAVHDFPVGIPTIHVWDTDMKPSNTQGLIVEVHNDIPPVNQWLEPSWFGIVCATVIPPKDMYHPILIHFDESMNKSVASCNPIIKGVFTSVEFQKALEHGYELIQVHRFDKYHRKPSLWGDTIKDLFIEKMVNSGPLPSLENQQRIKREYEERFGMGDDLQKTFDQQRWEKNPAKKKTFKIMLNSGWGKHAQRQNLIQTAILHQDRHIQEQTVLFENFSSNRLHLRQVLQLNEHEHMFRFDRGDVKPDLHDTFIPAGLFVPAYGRLHLWEQLHKLGKRVLMNDTDSIIYIYDPEKYNIPQGDIWGDWEVEDIDKRNGGIVEFVGVGPKTYSIKCKNGVTQTKCKGLSLKLATDEIVNHETMKALVVHPSGSINTSQMKMNVPQQSFVYVLGKGISTRKILKELAFNPEDLKGVLNEEGYLYPFGGVNCV